MDFQEICEFFGGSIFYDDLRGDITDFSGRLRRRTLAAAIVSIDEAASALLLTAVYCLFTPNKLYAEQALEQLQQESVWGPRWALRAQVYTALYRRSRISPPIFQSADLGGPAFQIWGKAGNFSRLTTLQSFRDDDKLRSTISRLDLLELDVVTTACFAGEITQAYTRRWNPNVPGAFQYAADNFLEQAPGLYEQSEFIKDQLRSLVDESLECSLPLIAAHVWRCIYELQRAQGLPDAIKSLDAMRDIYTSVGDDNGLGLYWSLRGDHNISSPVTSPLLLNLIIMDCFEDDNGDSQPHYSRSSDLEGLLEMTAEEQRAKNVPFYDMFGDPVDLSKYHDAQTTWLSPNDIEERILRAENCYGTALTHFEKEHAKRGIAATWLRQACLQRIRNMQSFDFWTARQAHIEHFRSLLTKCMDLCQECGDNQLYGLAYIHRSVSGIVDRDTLMIAKSIGELSSAAKNEIYGLGLALLALRISHHARYYLGSYHTAYGASEVSGQILNGLEGFRMVWYQAIVTQLNLTQNMGKSAIAILLVRQLEAHYPKLVAELTRPRHILAEDDTLAGLRIGISVSITKAMVGAVISLGPLSDASYPGEYVEGLMGTLPVKIWSTWLDQQRIRIAYKRAASAKRHMQEGNLKAVKEAYVGFLTDENIRRREDLLTLSYRIDLAVEIVPEGEAIPIILSEIKDTDQIPECNDQWTELCEGSKMLRSRPDQGALASLEIIFVSCIRARDFARAKRLLTRIEKLSPGYFTLARSYGQLWPWQRCLYAGAIHEAEENVIEASRFYGVAEAFVSNWDSITTHVDSNHIWADADLNRIMGAAARRAAIWTDKGLRMRSRKPPRRIVGYAGEIIGSVPADQRIEEALQYLENARPHYVWSRGKRGEPSSQEVRRQYIQEACMNLLCKVRLTPEERQELDGYLSLKDDEGNPLAEYEYLRAQHADPRPEDLTPEQLYTSIPEDCLVVYTHLSDDGVLLFGVDTTGILDVGWSPMYTNTVQNIALRMMNDILDDKGNNKSSMGDFSLGATLLSNILVKPLETAIDKKSHIIFILSGILTRIPIGALIYRKDHLMLQKQVSQVPSLTALYHLLRRTRSQDDQLTTGHVIARPGNRKDPPEEYEWLPMAGIEAKLVADFMGTTALNAKDVSRSDLQAYLKESAMLHICTHGMSDAGFTFNSHLVLKERFRVLDLLAIQTQVLLVTFSACLSGAGYASDSGDVQGFSHTLLASGANAYLGALWKVNDVATMMHMYFFYSELFNEKEKPTLAKAWHLATVKLYNLTTEGAIHTLEYFIERWDAWVERGDDMKGFVGGNGKRKLELRIEGLKCQYPEYIIDYKHPKIWAPFVLVGNATATL